MLGYTSSATCPKIRSLPTLGSRTDFCPGSLRKVSLQRKWPILPVPGSRALRVDGSSPREGWSVPPSRGLWFLISLQMKPKAEIMLISSSASHYFSRSCNRNNHFESNVSRKGNTFLNFQPIWKAASVLLCGWKRLF